MKKYCSKTAFTLIELIVSTLLVVIVLMGIYSISNVLTNNNQDYGQRYLVRSETQATLNRILNDAALAAGSVTTVGTGAQAVPETAILIGAGMGAANNNSFCIDQRPGGPGTDGWVCYMFDPVLYQITTCNKVYNLADVNNFRGAGAACVGTFVGSAFSITNKNGNNNSPPLFVPNANPLTFSITIQNCLNNTAGTCSNTGTSTDPANNPEVQLSGSVIPTQASSG